MAASGHFLTEIQTVDATKSIAYVVNTSTYASLEWSYAYSGSTYTVTGGSDLACEYGAAWLLYTLGFRYYTPNPEFWKRPASITTGLSKAKGAWWFPTNTVFLVYGHSWGGTKAAWRTALTDAMTKWQTLVGMRTEAYPAGHRWGGIVTPNLAWFQANPQVVKGGAAGLPPTTAAAAVKFDLAIVGTDYTNLVNICAAQLILEGVNEWKATHFDPSDGDTNTSQQVFQFSKDVATAMRAGTPAIGSHPARTGIAGAMLGVYAYAGHRTPHTVDLEDKVFTQVALGFNNTGLTYEQLVDAHAAQSPFVMLREYLSTEVWDDGYAWLSKAFDRYVDRYDPFQASGAIGTKSELGANWLVNMVMLQDYLYKCMTGTTRDASVIVGELVDDIFGGDPAAEALLNYWYDPSVWFDKWSLRKSGDYINAMQASWHKTYFEQLFCVWRAKAILPHVSSGSYVPSTLVRLPVNEDYRTAISKALKWAAGIAPSDLAHSYAFVRQYANTNVNVPGYADLMFNAVPEPDWFANATAPTHADFLAELAIAQAAAVRDEDLDSDDLVLMTGITPRATATTPATMFFSMYRAVYKFVGSGTVTVQQTSSSGSTALVEYVDEEGNVTFLPAVSPVTTSYGPGVHSIILSGYNKVSHSGGYLFLDTFSKVRKDPDGTFIRHWLYIPNRATGIVSIQSDSRVTIYDQSGRLDILPDTPAATVANRGPGQIAIDNGNTRGNIINNNCNRWLSLRADIALLPRVIAEEDFTTRCAITVAA